MNTLFSGTEHQLMQKRNLFRQLSNECLTNSGTNVTSSGIKTREWRIFV